VVTEVARQMAEGQRGIVGVMLESFLVPGRQDLDPTRSLVYGQSITDACLGWPETEQVLADLASAVRARRVAVACGDLD
jgi:3-deoxy-7-phosphoheptulonate synthase